MDWNRELARGCNYHFVVIAYSLGLIAAPHQQLRSIPLAQLVELVSISLIYVGSALRVCTNEIGSTEIRGRKTKIPKIWFSPIVAKVNYEIEIKPMRRQLCGRFFLFCRKTAGNLDKRFEQSTTGQKIRIF